MNSSDIDDIVPTVLSLCRQRFGEVNGIDYVFQDDDSIGLEVLLPQDIEPPKPEIMDGVLVSFSNQPRLVAY
jgi:hypothetical protein